MTMSRKRCCASWSAIAARAVQSRDTGWRGSTSRMAARICGMTVCSGTLVRIAKDADVSRGDQGISSANSPLLPSGSPIDIQIVDQADDR